MKESTNHLLFSILRSVFHDHQMCSADKLLVTEDSLAAIMELAYKHDIAHIVALGILNNGLADEKVKPQIQQVTFSAVYRYEKINHELDRLCDALETAQIPFMPLKGSVMRKYYAEPWLRTSCDIDILVHKEDLRGAISYLVDHLNYTEHEQNSHDVSLYSPGGIHVELHYKLTEDGLSEAFTNILLTAWDSATQKAGSSYHYEMSDSMFYFYHIVHMAKHFEHGGCGIRPFIDLWILDSIEERDTEEINALLQKGTLLRFAEISRKLSKIWLDGDEMEPITEKMENYVLDGGAYGTLENRIAVTQQKLGGKIQYAYSKIVLPYYIIKHHYPILQKHPWLTPVMEVCRWFKLIFCGHAKRSLQELAYNKSISKSHAEDIKVFLKEMGLS
ncbi:MAG: hypothetical protein E7393_00635 [Ruminococcaceae bacterium]|nr:hypothetical protein [Oscillospiraceae bacterium]